jgi:hypothetical protein
MRRGVTAACVLALALVEPAFGAGAPAGHSAAANAVTIAAAPNPVVFGASTAITGLVTGKHASGAAVSLEAKPFPYTGTFAKVSSATADATGHYSIKIAPSLNTVYEVVAHTAPPATSPTVLVRVRVSVSLRVSTRTPAIGQSVRFSGFVLPAYNGKAVRIQRRTSAGWRTVAKATLVAATPVGTVARSKYSKRLRIRKSGSYRVRFVPPTGRITNHSPIRRLTVH